MLLSHLEDADRENILPASVRKYADALRDILKDIDALLKNYQHKENLNSDMRRHYYLDQLFDTTLRITDWMNFKYEPNYRKKIRGKRMRQALGHLSNADLIDLCINVKEALLENPDWVGGGSLRLNTDVLLMQLRKRIEKGELQENGRKIINGAKVNSQVFQARSVIAQIDHLLSNGENDDFLHAGWVNIRTLYDAVVKIRVVNSYKLQGNDDCEHP